MPASLADALAITRTGLQVCESHLAVKSMNIAGQGLDGFKRKYIIATDLPYHDYELVGARTSDTSRTASGTGTSLSPTGLQIGMGVQLAGIYANFSQGDPIQTNNPLDVMIDGEGFFKVLLPSGEYAYTRIGAWQLNPDGQIVMPKTGYVLADNIKIPPETKSVYISPSGEVFARMDPEEDVSIGNIKITTFINANGLKAIGDSMYVETPASGQPDEGSPGELRHGVIKQGYREGSNVNAVEEVTDLIRIEKNYELLTKVAKTADSMMEKSNNIRS